MQGNLVSTGGSGASVLAQGGATAYSLPAPAGHWIAGTMCEVYRQACARNGKGILMNPICQSDRAECRRKVGNITYTDKGRMCRPLLLNQPCDWELTPELIGEAVQALPPGPLEMDFPSPCSAGLLGSTDTAYQASPLCAGKCPRGKYCPGATTTALDCPATGKYCPEGTSSPLPCEAGTYSNRIGNDAASDCTVRHRPSSGLAPHVGSTPRAMHSLPAHAAHGPSFLFRSSARRALPALLVHRRRRPVRLARSPT